MFVYHKKFRVAFFILCVGLTCGIGFQIYKIEIGVDDFWNIRLLLSVILGSLLFYAFHHAWARVLKFLLGFYTTRIQIEDMKTYLPLGLILLYPLQKQFLFNSWPKSLFPLFLSFYVLFVVAMKVFLIFRVKKEHAEASDSTQAASAGNGWLCMAALTLSLPVFGFHQLTLAYDDFYGFYRLTSPKAFYFRHNWVTRKTYPYDRTIMLSSHMPFDRATAVVGYKILDVPKEVVLLPITFRLSARDDKGIVLADKQHTLDPALAESRQWHNFEIGILNRKGASVDFTMKAGLDPLAHGWGGFCRFFLQPLRDFSRYRDITHHAAWSEPEIVLSKQERPNVIIISLDTLRADVLGCYGGRRNVSPAVDAFAAENVMFENAFCQSTWTFPSHLSMFTGKFPNELFDVMSYLPVGELDAPEYSLNQVSNETLADILNKSGYYCAAFTDGVYVSSYYGFYKGFHLYDEQYGPGRNSFRLAEEWIEKNAEKNYFLFIHTFLIHDYDACDIGNLLTLKGSTPEELDELLHSVRLLFPEIEDAESFLTHDHDRRRRDWYDIRVRLVDSHISEFFSFMKQNDMYDDSLIIVLSDHGEAFEEIHDNGRHHVDRHGFAPYESQARVPLIIKLPGTSPNPLLVKEDVRLLDIPQTVLTVLGLEQKTTFRGRCIVPGFPGQGTDEYPFSYATWSVPGGSLREHGRKYIYHGKGAPDEFYNLEEDPGETRNLAIAGTDEVLRFRARYQEFISKTGDGGITVCESAEGIPADIRDNLKALGYIE